MIRTLGSLRNERAEHQGLGLCPMKSSKKVMTLTGIFLLGVVFAFMPLGYASDGAATEALKGTIDQVLVVLQDESLKGDDKKEKRLDKITEVIGERFDYEEMGKRTLAREWKPLNESQREEFVSLFQRFITKSYAGNVDSYSGETIEYIKERNKGDYAEVQTKVMSSKVQVPLDYRMLKKNSVWRVYDVVIDGVSLMKNYRGQFSRIIKSSSFDGLLKKLREKTGQTG